MKIAIASDHGGVRLKNVLIPYLKGRTLEVLDLSPFNEDTDDYPDFAYKVSKSVVNGECDLGVLICRSGTGMAITANKIKGVYCGRIVSVKDAVHAVNDNGINVISLDGDGGLSDEEAKRIIDAFLDSEPLNDQRHIRRMNKIIKIESGEYNEL